MFKEDKRTRPQYELLRGSEWTIYVVLDTEQISRAHLQLKRYESMTIYLKWKRCQKASENTINYKLSKN
jgi:hypothetical protein